MKLHEMLLDIYNDVPRDNSQVFMNYLLEHCPDLTMTMQNTSISSGDLFFGLFIGLIVARRYGISEDVPAWLQGPELNWRRK